MGIIRDINYSLNEDKKKVLDIYLPEKEVNATLIYFHGGGLETGDKADADFFAEYLNKRNIAVVSANYRMYHEAKYPEFILDAAEAVNWVKNNIKKYCDCDKIYVGGSSAGGYLSMMLCFDKQYLASYGISPMDFAGFIHDAGQPTCHFNVLGKRGIDPRRIIIDETAPLYHVGTSPEYPPMLFMVSDNDMPGRYEQTMLMMSALKNFEYDMKKIELKVINGGHCQYTTEKDRFGELVIGFLLK